MAQLMMRFAGGVLAIAVWATQSATPPALRLAPDLDRAQGRDARSGQADLALVNGRILTVDDRFRVAAALAVRDGRFVAVGSNDDVRRYIGSGTRVIDARGRTVLPGLIDTHVHALDVAEAEAVQPFQNLQSIDALQTWIRSAVRSGQQDAWIWTPRVYPA